MIIYAICRVVEIPFNKFIGIAPEHPRRETMNPA